MACCGGTVVSYPRVGHCLVVFNLCACWLATRKGYSPQSPAGFWMHYTGFCILMHCNGVGYEIGKARQAEALTDLVEHRPLTDFMAVDLWTSIFWLKQ